MPRCPRRLNSSHARPGPVRRRRQQAVVGRNPGLGEAHTLGRLSHPSFKGGRGTSSSSFSVPSGSALCRWRGRTPQSPRAGHWPVKSSGPLVLCPRHPDPPYRHAACRGPAHREPPRSLHTQISPLPRAAPRPFCPLQQWPILKTGQEASPPFWKES